MLRIGITLRRIQTDPACHFDVDPVPACHFDAVANPNPNLDPTFHFDADPDPYPSYQIKAQNLEKVLR